jgi:hypothetical protein
VPPTDAAYCNNSIESDHRHIKRRLRAMQGPRTNATAWAVIQGAEAAQMIRKGQVLGITRQNLRGQAWVFGTLFGVVKSFDICHRILASTLQTQHFRLATRLAIEQHEAEAHGKQGRAERGGIQRRRWGNA